MAMDWVLMIVGPLVATIASLVFGFGLVGTTILFFGVPAAYLTWRKPQLFRKSVIFTGVVMVGIVSLDHSIYLDHAWNVTHSVLRFFNNTVSIEELIWAAVWIYFAIVFWEYFLETDLNKAKMPGKFWRLIGIVALIAGGFGVLYVARSPWLVQPYYYLKFGLVFVAIPAVIGWVKCPKVWKKIIIIGLYFFFVSWVHELVSLQLNHWTFPGKNYVSTLNLRGHLVPWEEIVFWWILGVPALIYWYEMFADDGR